MEQGGVASVIRVLVPALSPGTGSGQTDERAEQQRIRASSGQVAERTLSTTTATTVGYM